MHKRQKSREPKIKTFLQNPKIDFLFGHLGKVIPSKKEDFKPTQIKAIYENGEEEILNEYYVKKPSSKSVREFEQLIHKQIMDAGYQDDKIQKPHLVEVFIGITLKQKKYFDIDVDNIAKTVLDALTNYIFEDDSQVKRVICEKDIHPLNSEGFFIAVTKLTPERKGLMDNYFLFSEEN